MNQAALKIQAQINSQQNLPLPSRCFKQAEVARVEYHAVIPVGIPFKNINDPKYWSNCAMMMRQLTKIEVVAEDMSYYAEGIVVSCNKVGAVIRWVNYHDWSPKEGEDSGEQDLYSQDELEVGWGGPTQKWRIIRTSDNQVIESGIAEKSEAYKRIGELLGNS